MSEERDRAYEVVDEVMRELVSQQDDASIAATSVGNRTAECVWCGKSLYDSPTDEFWIRALKHDEGLCYMCVVSCMKAVVCGLSVAPTPTAEEKGGE